MHQLIRSIRRAGLKRKKDLKLLLKVLINAKMLILVASLPFAVAWSPLISLWVMARLDTMRSKAAL
jgi:hypothetical protein